MLQNNQEIVVLRPDRGNDVIINRKDYICGMNNIINDTSKFKLLTADLTSYRKGSYKGF